MRVRPACVGRLGTAWCDSASMARSVDALDLVLASPRETELIGKIIGRVLHEGDVVALIGDLGTGKTALVQGIVAGLGLPSASAASPTFVLMHQYQGRLALTHVDLYRLRSREEAELIGLSECFTEDGVTAIEWADRFPGLLPEDRLEVRLAHKTFTTRTAQFRPRGARSHQLLARIKTAMQRRLSARRKARRR
jgi:tRNA threonylcarbamoyladenosine biosynthesis protein TsaE